MECEEFILLDWSPPDDPSLSQNVCCQTKNKSNQYQGGLFESKYLDRLEYQGWQLEAWDELVRTMVVKQSLDCNLGENVHWH